MDIDFQDCLIPYQGHDITLSYPDIWEFVEETEGSDVILTVQASATCFWTLRIMPACPPPPQVVESCVEAFQEEYEDVEIAPNNQSLSEMPSYGRDLEFFCMELMNSVGLRSVRTTDFTLLVWWQGTHHELVEAMPILEGALMNDCAIGQDTLRW